MNEKHSIIGSSNLISYAWPRIKPHMSFGILVFLALMLTSGAMAGIIKTLRHFVDSDFNSKEELIRCTLVFFGFAAVFGFSSFLRVFSVKRLASKFCSDVRIDLLNKILHLPLKFFDHGDKTNWVEFTTQNLNEMLRGGVNIVSDLLKNITIFSCILVMLMLNDWKLAMVVLTLLPIVMVAISVAGFKLRKSIQFARNLEVEIFSEINESVTLLRTIKVFSGANQQISKFKKIVKASEDYSHKLALARGGFVGLMMILAFFSVTVVLYLGGLEILEGRMSIGALSAFLFQSIIAASSLGSAVEGVAELMKYRVDFKKLVQISQAKEELALDNDWENPKETIPTENNLNFTITDLSFSYEEGGIGCEVRKVLKNINLQIKQGQKIAIIGPSGNGKSTLASILLGLYDDYSGQVLLNGIEIRNFDTLKYRTLFGVVTQEISIFSGTILDNLLYANSPASETEIQDILEKLNLWETVKSMPLGLNTLIGNSGQDLSMGQKQRLAVARAVLKKSKVLVFDEATASLDNKNADMVYKLVLESTHQTQIFITHRLEHLDKMDLVIEI